MASVGVRGRNGATSVSGGTRRDPGYVVMLWKSCSDLCRSSMLSDFVLVSVSSRFGRAYLCTQGSSRRRSSRAAARRRTLGRRRRRGHQRLSAPVGRGHVEDGRGKSAALLYCLTRREQRPELAGDGRDGILPPSVLEGRNLGVSIRPPRRCDSYSKAMGGGHVNEAAFTERECTAVQL